MNKTHILRLLIFAAVVCCSCRNKTVKLLTGKWECIQAEHVFPPGLKYLSPEDSVNAIQVQAIIKSLNWTFKNNMRYECAVGSRVTVKGKYELQEDDKILVCTPESKNNVNRYFIKSLNEYELVLSSNAANTGLVLHFKPY